MALLFFRFITEFREKPRDRLRRKSHSIGRLETRAAGKSGGWERFEVAALRREQVEKGKHSVVQPGAEGY